MSLFASLGITFRSILPNFAGDSLIVISREKNISRGIFKCP